MKVTSFYQGIVNWPSLGIIQTILLNFLKKKFLNLNWSVACNLEKYLFDTWFRDNNRTFVSHYPVDNKIFRKKKNIRSQFDSPKNMKLMLYAGRLSYQKNILSLFDFIYKNRDLYLVLCGDSNQIWTPHFSHRGNFNYSSHFFATIKKIDLSSRISIFPFQGQRELSELMNSCDYQISLGSHYGEDFGYSIAQGLCSDLKAIVSDWGGHKNWSNIGLKKSISYIGLQWDNPKVGFPKIPAYFELPKSSPTGWSAWKRGKLALAASSGIWEKRLNMWFQQGVVFE